MQACRAECRTKRRGAATTGSNVEQVQRSHATARDARWDEGDGIDGVGDEDLAQTVGGGGRWLGGNYLFWSCLQKIKERK